MQVKKLHFDLAVIGSGPAGQKAAIQAAKLGKQVVIIEKGAQIGGNSLHSGTIPSKSLREAILVLSDFYKKSFYGREGIQRHNLSIHDLNSCLKTVIQTQVEHLQRQLDKNHIEVIDGLAHFENPSQLAVIDHHHKLTHLVAADKIVIATGSKPRNPNHIPFDSKRVIDPTRLLCMKQMPCHMVVLGGGIIGSEYASFFAALGVKVVVVDQRDHILPLLDREIGLHLQKALEQLGMTFIGNKKVKAVIKQEECVQVHFQDGSSIQSELLLYALGRTAQVDQLHIDQAKIGLDSKGYIPVNALFQTSVPHIYAVGDVIGGPCLASTSMEQGRLAARHAFGAQTHHFPTFYPIGIYTIPEISSCGYTEEQLRQLNFRYEVGRAYYYEVAKSCIGGDHSGLFKILFHADTLEILGVHIVGREATEMIHIGQVAMTFSARIDYFIDQVFNYPTYAEGYRIAALNGVNKVKRKK